MIVKNEEKNIKTALGWAKGHAFEQIVVDTGSTDRTVELAEQFGAKVYSFEWIHDFAAAKNFAIEQATGDWIAFLDADEYLSSSDAEKLMKLLSKTDIKSDSGKDCLGIIMPWVNVDDNGKPMTISSQVRVFRNDPSVRYNGRVHESLNIGDDRFINADDIDIIHTGYSESSHIETGKADRNIKLLRKELTDRPGDVNIKAYLANDLSMSNDESNQTEAEKLFLDVMKSNKKISVVHKIKALLFLTSRYSKQPDMLDLCEEMCRRTLKEFPGVLDIEYLLASTLSKKGDYEGAWELLKSCENTVLRNSNPDDSIMIPADPTVLFAQMILTAKNLGDIESVILYSTHVLSMDKTRKSVLAPCIATLLHYGVTEHEIIDLLSNIYDMDNTEDVRIIAQAARECGATTFAENILRFSEGDI